MENNENLESASEKKFEYKLYRRRWLMLFIFSSFSMINAFQWIQYSIIKDIVMKYYSVDGIAVDWTTMIGMVSYIPLVFPASAFLDKKGLRWSILLGAFGTAAGGCIKIASVGPDLFYVTFIGQTLIAISEIFVFSVPPILAAVWFGPDEVSTACSIGVFGNLLGVAIGFLIPPIIVKNHDNIDDIGSELAILYYIVAGVSTAIFIAALLFFQARPPTPPSPQQAFQKENAAKNEDGFWNLVKRLFKNTSYVVILLGYAINQGVFNALSTLLNQLILVYFKNGEEFAGRIGLLFIISGMIAGVLFGVILDATHRYKEVAVAVFALSLVGLMAFTYALTTQSEAAVYVTTTIMGIFLGGYMPMSYDFAAEITYPEPEGMVAGIFTLPTQIFGFLYTLAYAPMLDSWGPIWSNVGLGVTILIATILHAIIRPELRRQAVATNTQSNNALLIAFNRLFSCMKR